MTSNDANLGGQEFPKLGRIGIWSSQLRHGDHVCLQVVAPTRPGAQDISAMRPVWRVLADALL